MGINLDSLSKALTVASLAIAVFAAWKAVPLDADLKALEAQTKRLDLDLKAAEISSASPRVSVLALR